VAGDGDGIARVSTTGLDNTDFLPRRARGSTGDFDLLLLVVVVERVEHMVSGTLDTTAEGVVLAVVVVVTHFALGWLFENGSVLGGSFDVGLGTVGFDVYFTCGLARFNYDRGFVSAVVTGVDVADLSVATNVLGLIGRVGTATVITLSDIKLRLVGLLTIDS
jgi:hypothetical protein